MTVDVKAGSFAAVPVTVSGQTQGVSSSISSGVKSSSNVSAVRADTAQMLVQITASNKLTGVEKTGLIRDIAVVDNFASKDANLRKTLLNNVMRNTMVLENSAPVRVRSQSISLEQATQRYVAVSKNTPPTTQKQVESSIDQRVSRTRDVQPKVTVTQSDIDNSLAQVSPESIQRVQRIAASLTTNGASDVQQAPAPVQDSVNISPAPVARKAEPEIVLSIPGARLGADIARVSAPEFEALPMPGAGGGDNFIPEIILPGGGEVPVVALPGSGSGEGVVALSLPGSGEIEFEQVALPGSGAGSTEVDMPVFQTSEAEFVADIQLPGALVDETVGMINSNPDQALAALADIQLPGAGGAEEEAATSLLRRLL